MARICVHTVHQVRYGSHLMRLHYACLGARGPTTLSLSPSACIKPAYNLRSTYAPHGSSCPTQIYQCCFRRTRTHRALRKRIRSSPASAARCVVFRSYFAYAFGCLYRCPRPSLASPLVFTLYMSPGPTYTLYTCMQAPVPFAYLLLVHTTNYPTCQVSAAGGLFSAQDVAAACLNGIKKNKYTITVVCALPR